MPLIDLKNEYRHNWYSYNKHLSTIVPVITRKVEGVDYSRERLTLSDGDFLDLDWIKGGHNRLLILTHGLEGNSNKHYVKGMALQFLKTGWDILSWNCRSCSGEMNKGPKLYHHGDIGDITEVFEHAIKINHYSKIGLAGFSMGGVINSKFLVKTKFQESGIICVNIAISTPCDLKACAQTLGLKKNFIYKNKFLKSLTAKLIAKEAQHPGLIDLDLLSTISSWYEFDNKISAPFIGYKNAEELYANASINQWLTDIKVPTLILNSLDDPLIPIESNPFEIAKSSRFINLAFTKKGGHCGFQQKNSFLSFSEDYTLSFVDKIIK